MSDPLAPLSNALILQHRHRILLRHLPGLDPSINRATGAHIAEPFGELAVELRETRLENKRVQDKKENKVAAVYFGANLAHLLNLVQVTETKDLPPVWESLAQATKHQQLLVFKRAFNTATEDMGLRAPTIATPFLVKLVLLLRFQMESRDDLMTGLHPFVLGHHKATVRKFLLGQANRYAMVDSGADALCLADVEILSAPSGVTLQRNFSMARGQWLSTRMIVGTCFYVDHNASEGLKEFGGKMSARETDLEEYIPCDAALRSQVLALILCHAQIRWSNWISVQWGKTSEVTFPNLTGLWTAMENQEPREPTFPAGYTLPSENGYRGSDSACPDLKPAYLARNPTVNTLATPTSAAAAAAVVPTSRAESARRSSGVHGSSGGEGN